VRIIATLRFIFDGIQALPQNFREGLFVVDLCEPVRLVPGYSDISTIVTNIVVWLAENEGKFYRGDARYYAISDEDVFSSRKSLTVEQYIAKGQEKDKQPNYVIDYSPEVAKALTGLILYIPALLYRASLKSTFWLYLPIIYIARTETRSYPVEYRLDVMDSRWEYFRRVLALSSLTAFAALTLFDFYFGVPIEIQQKIVSVAELMYMQLFYVMANIFVLRWASWQLLSVFAALITLFIFFKIGDARSAFRHSVLPGEKLKKQLHLLEVSLRARNVCSTFSILILLFHIVIITSPIVKYLPSELTHFIARLYGENNISLQTKPST
jgi:hypothetical protein